METDAEKTDDLTDHNGGLPVTIRFEIGGRLT
jgi:hypothetical protein